MRIKKSITNASFGIVSVIAEILSKIFITKLFINFLGSEIYGLDSFIKGIMGIFSLAELGISSVIGFSLYKPISENNRSQIIALMQFYKKIYQKIGLITLCIGIIFAPFLAFLPATCSYKNSLLFLYSSYSLFLLGTSSIYFFSYSNTFLIASEKGFIVSFIKIINLLIASFVLIFGIITKKYTLYLIIWVFFQFLESFSTYLFVKKKYSYVLTKKKYTLLKSSKQKIIKNIKALITHRIGATLVLETDQFLVSNFEGLKMAGYFSNYLIMIWSVQKILNQIFDGIRASFGNFSQLKTKEEVKKMFLVFQMLGFILYAWSSCFILNLCQPFMILWLGKNTKLSFLAVVLFVISFYLRGFRSALDLVKDVNGIYYQDRYKPVIEGIVNLFFSIIFVKIMGYEGIIFGTIISFVGVLLTVEPYVVYKYAFKEKVTSYYKSYLKYFLIFIIICTSSFFVCSFTNEENLSRDLMFKFTVCSILPIILFFILLGRKQEFKFLLSLFKKLILRF